MTEKDKKNENQKADAELQSRVDEIIAAAEKKVQEMIENARLEAENIVKRAETAKPPAGLSEDTKKANGELEEYVPIKLFKDGERYKDDVYVCVNGENCLIKRGVQTMIKRKFKNVLDQSQMQDETASAMSERLADDFVKATENRGL